MKHSKQNQKNFKEVTVKRIVMLVAAMLLSVTAASAEEEYKTQFEFRARPEFRANFNADEELTRSDFNVVRGYVGMSQDITENMRGRLVVDVDASGPVDDIVTGGTRVRLRYADVYWTFAPIFTLGFGLLPDDRSFMPNTPSNLCNDAGALYFTQAGSSDYGMEISGEQGMFSYGLQVVNGERNVGFRGGRVNTIPLFLGNVSVKPMDLIGVDLSLGYTQNEVEDTLVARGYVAGGSIVDIAGQGSIEHDLFEFVVQAAYSMNTENDDAESVNSMAMYFEPMVKLEDLINIPLSVVCGIALLDEDTAVEEDEQTRIIPGLVFRPHRAVTMLLSYEMINNADTEDSMDSSNLRFRIDYRLRTSTK